MIKQENLSEHIASLSPRQWSTLFDLLPQIKSLNRFGKLMGAKQMQDGSYTFPYWSEDQIVSRFYNAAHLLGLVVVFDWAAWKEGIEILNDPTTDYNELDCATLCKLLTVIIRSDKFCEGYLINSFETGVVTQIIEAMRNKTMTGEMVRAPLQSSHA